MLHVPGRSMIVMDSVTDRMRLKDKILANIAKAVKSIQELQILSGQSTVTLGNQDCQCHRLCEHLDHALLHGLRHVTPGYWMVVREFTHRDCVKEIKRMRNVTTDLGKGRSWLFMALNEGLLESYIRCYQQNEGLVADYYVKDALVRDQQVHSRLYMTLLSNGRKTTFIQSILVLCGIREESTSDISLEPNAEEQRWNVLLTLTSGLENAIFQLDSDVPYLDLCVYPPKSQRLGGAHVEPMVEFDKLSLCSMESVHLGSSKPLPQAVVTRQESHRSLAGTDSDSNSVASGDLVTGQQYSPSVDSGIHSDWNFRQRSITPIDSLGDDSGRHHRAESLEIPASGGNTSLEVIRLTKKGRTHKNKKRKSKKFVSVSHITDPAIPDVPVNPTDDSTVVELPPIDNVDFTVALKNSQNNDDVDSSLPTSSDTSWVSELRSPGDGIESDKADIVVNNVSVSTVKDAGGDTFSNGVDIDTDIKDGKTNNELGSVSSVSDNRNRDSGIFTELIKSKVYSLADMSDNTDVSSHVSDVCDNSFNRTNESYDSLDILDEETNSENVQYNNIESHLYDNDTQSYDENPVPGNANKNENSEHSVKPSATPTSDVEKKSEPEISIYSKHNDSDSSDSESDFNALTKVDIYTRKSNTSTPSQRSNTSTPSQRSNTSTPSRALSARSNASTPSRVYSTHSNRSTPSKELENLRRPASTNSVESLEPAEGRISFPPTTTKLDSDVSDYDSSTSRNTPDFLSANQKRKESVSSSANETEEEAINQTGRSKLSPYQKHVYSESPLPSTDEEKLTNQVSSENPSPDVELQGSEQELQGRVDELINQRDPDQFHHLTYVEEELEDTMNFKDALDQRERTHSLSYGEIELDNNTMLFLMLDVLEGDETFVKMFSCRQGHTEGKTRTVFLLLSTKSLYILDPQDSRRRFTKETVISFLDIDFVSLGLNSQLIQVVCKNRRLQHFFTTGDERVSVAIVDCLAASMETSELKPARLEVDTDALTQKISLRKYIMKECRCEMDVAEPVCYSLVHWEDPNHSAGACESDREGHLLYRSHETTNMLGAQTWRPAYAVLKDCMLCLYLDKNDSKPAHYLSMGGEQCVGCKRDFNSDRNHSIRVMLADGSYWSISLASEAEANSWILGLCQAVSDGVQMSAARTSCIPCCLVLSQQKLLLCHEDVETNFVRTLASSSLLDITAVLTDELNDTFLVLAFDSQEANVSSEKWVLYFNSDYESKRWQSALSECWQVHYQVQVPIISMEDFTLQKKCREMDNFLRSSLALKN